MRGVVFRHVALFCGAAVADVVPVRLVVLRSLPARKVPELRVYELRRARLAAWHTYVSRVLCVPEKRDGGSQLEHLAAQLLPTVCMPSSYARPAPPSAFYNPLARCG